MSTAVKWSQQSAVAHARMRILIAVALLTSVLPAYAADDWNPEPAAGDVIISLPCNQKMVFRKIVTDDAARDGTTAILDDRRIRLGSANQAKAYLDYLRADFISGNFQKAGTRFYLLGKYEVTVAQYKSITQQGCAFATDDTTTPIARVSWFDATNFARQLSSHLLRTGKDVLRLETGSTKVFARLPTETEWEFAARGGLAVSIADFQAERFPMQGSLTDYAWVNDPMSAEDVNPIGTRQPNPLRLHDMYGNLAEMMLEPFRMNKAGRMHGLAGGIILKGGSFQSNPGFVNSSQREEDAFFIEESGDEKRTRTVGFRPVIVGPALSTDADVNLLVREWERASASRLPANDDPVKMVEQTREGIADLALAKSLDSIEQAIRKEIAESAEEQKALLSGLLVGLGKATYDIRRLQSEINQRAALFKPDMVRTLGEREIRLLRERTTADEGEIRNMIHFAHDIIVRIANVFTADEIAQQAQTVAGELRLRHLGAIAESVLIGATIAAPLASSRQQLSREDVLKQTVKGL